MASYETDKTGTLGEVAFAVTDRMHGHGLGTLLLEHLVSDARHRGVTTFTAYTAPLKRTGLTGLPCRLVADIDNTEQHILAAQRLDHCDINATRRRLHRDLIDRRFRQ